MGLINYKELIDELMLQRPVFSVMDVCNASERVAAPNTIRRVLNMMDSSGYIERVDWSDYPIGVARNTTLWRKVKPCIVCTPIVASDPMSSIQCELQSLRMEIRALSKLVSEVTSELIIVKDALQSSNK